MDLNNVFKKQYGLVKFLSLMIDITTLKQGTLMIVLMIM
jgi:hypothetical protein